MTPMPSDALVLFGATGDLCHRKIFPSLYQLVRRGRLKVPVIGVAKAGWTRDQLLARLRDSLKNYVQDADPSVVERFVALVQYVDGDYGALETFRQLRRLRHYPHQRGFPGPHPLIDQLRMVDQEGRHAQPRGVADP